MNREVKVLEMCSPDFFPDVNPKGKPDRPEKSSEDYEDPDEECPVCSVLVCNHDMNQIVSCALSEIRRGGIK